MKVEENIFKENHMGVLSHDGVIKFAKSNIKQKILHIGEDNILVRGRKKSYSVLIHKQMYDYLDFLDKGDYAFIKFKNGKAYIVGFQKQGGESDANN